MEELTCSILLDQVLFSDSRGLGSLRKHMCLGVVAHHPCVRRFEQTHLKDIPQCLSTATFYRSSRSRFRKDGDKNQGKVNFGQTLLNVQAQAFNLTLDLKNGHTVSMCTLSMCICM